MKRCQECHTDALRITGVGRYGDTIEVECRQCNAAYSLDSGGAGQVGEEALEASLLSLWEDPLPIRDALRSF